MIDFLNSNMAIYGTFILAPKVNPQKVNKINKVIAI